VDIVFWMEELLLSIWNDCEALCSVSFKLLRGDKDTILSLLIIGF
jgi:hypothetical protein